MARTEDIEAKLAAYVDGELDEAGRAEIEKHLVANPQHRQLIQDLMQQRQLLQGLPRESAPPEVAETLNSQLERSVLLTDVDTEVQAVSLRMSRWPQVRALAAILFLTFGLAGLIYYLLPSANRKPAEIADIRALPSIPATVPSSGETGVLADKSEQMPLALARPDSAGPAESRESLGRSAGEFPAPAVAAAETEQERRAKGALAVGPQATNFPATVTNAAPPANQLFQQVLGSDVKKDSESPSIVVVVPSNAPALANGALTRYLNDNKISWQTSTQAMPAPLNIDSRQQVFAARLQAPQYTQIQSGGGAQAGQTQLAQKSYQQNIDSPYQSQMQVPSDATMGLGQKPAETPPSAPQVPLPEEYARTPAPTRSETQLIYAKLTTSQAAELRALLANPSTQPQANSNSLSEPAATALPFPRTPTDRLAPESATTRPSLVDFFSMSPRLSVADFSFLAPAALSATPIPSAQVVLKQKGEPPQVPSDLLTLHPATLPSTMPDLVEMVIVVNSGTEPASTQLAPPPVTAPSLRP